MLVVGCFYRFYLKRKNERLFSVQSRNRGNKESTASMIYHKVCLPDSEEVGIQDIFKKDKEESQNESDQKQFREEIYYWWMEQLIDILENMRLWYFLRLTPSVEWHAFCQTQAKISADDTKLKSTFREKAFVPINEYLDKVIFTIYNKILDQPLFYLHKYLQDRQQYPLAQVREETLWKVHRLLKELVAYVFLVWQHCYRFYKSGSAVLPKDFKHILTTFMFFGWKWDLFNETHERGMEPFSKELRAAFKAESER